MEKSALPVMDKQYTRKCPSCNKVLYYTRNFSRNSADKQGRLCFSCSNKGENNPMFGKERIGGMLGKNHSINTRQKISDALIGKKHNEERKNKISYCVKEAMCRPDVRKHHLDSLSKTKWIKVRTDKGQLELIEKWNSLGFNLEPNYQVITNIDLFYIDGYDKEKNVVLEYDGKYHQKFEQKQKDLIRQKKIIDILKPKKFWRYNYITKQFRDVLREQ